jgi:hypothetical protein
MKRWSLFGNQGESGLCARGARGAACALVMFAAGLLAACGGGSDGAISAAATANPTGSNGAAVEAAAPDASNGMPAAQPNAAPPVTYSLRKIPPLPGPGSVFGQGGIDLTGDFIANVELECDRRRHAFVYHTASDSYEEVGDPDTDSQAAAIGNNGFVIGEVFTGQLFTGSIAFAWSKETGRIEIAGHVLGSSASSISDSGLIGGQNVQGVFEWDSSTSKLTNYPHFFLESSSRHTMNNFGSMAGRYVPPNMQGYPAILMRDGSVSRIDLPSPDVFAAFPIAIDDNGDVFLQWNENHPPLAAGLVVSAKGSTMNIGRGVATPPPGAIVKSEIASMTDLNSKGQLLGFDRVDFVDAQGMDGRIETGFLWSASEGTSVIRADSSLRTFPVGVNRDGVVVGVASLPAGSRAFLWTKESGVLELEALVSNMPPGAHLTIPEAIGDGGHVLAHLDDGSPTGSVVLLIPMASPTAP